MNDRYLFRAKRKSSPRRKDHTGEVYGNTKVIDFSHIDSGGNAYWNCMCGQCYDDLDLVVNSGSTRLARLSCKPKNIGRERIFKFPEHYRKYIA